jgi:alkylation response protein AidB-like acyl-CoA dehydrogenase
VDPVLLNPNAHDPAELDPETRRLIAATIEWFENRGKVRLKADYHDRVWYSDFLEFMAAEKAFATLLTPGSEGGAWDTARICAFGEVLAFYGLGYWYAWQVTILGLGPIWQSENTEARARAASLLQDGEVFAFGLSEKAHGADIYSTDMVLTPDGDGFRANGSKYYIGNGNVARMVSVFGRRADVEGLRGTCSSRPTAGTRRTAWRRTSSPGRCSSARSPSRTTRSPLPTSCTPARPRSTPR